MNKIRFLSIIVSLLLLTSLISCNKEYVINQDFCDKEEQRAEDYLLQSNKILSNYYPDCRLTESPFSERSREHGFYYDVSYDALIDDNTTISIEIISDFQYTRNDRYYCVKIEREFDDVNKNGFGSKDLKLFCDLSNIVSKEGLTPSMCHSLFKRRKNTINNDDFILVDMNISTLSGYELYYTVLDYKAGNIPEGGYCETLRSEFSA